MKRFLLIAPIALAVVVVCASGLFVFLRVRQPELPAPQSGLVRMPLSAYRYQLCTEVFAYAYATPDNPYKTDYEFQDPFRHTTDTITPYLLGYDAASKSVTFQVDVIIGHVATFHLAISNVHELDGIAVVLPDLRNHPLHTAVPQFIISDFGNGSIAVLDYTCPQQWVWDIT